MTSFFVTSLDAQSPRYFLGIKCLDFEFYHSFVLCTTESIFLLWVQEDALHREKIDKTALFSDIMWSKHLIRIIF